ncbi:MAG: hypothetical protein PWP56_2099 [Acetobacterium sp.]|nr:hypothetical protein [Eubacteriaceae bacterium]MDK2942586.1 hypothetical protein [Acetobacterium sp.]
MRLKVSFVSAPIKYCLGDFIRNENKDVEEIPRYSKQMIVKYDKPRKTNDLPGLIS